MSSRALRRAAERKAQKLAAKANNANSVAQAVSPAASDLQSANAGRPETILAQQAQTASPEILTATASVGGSDQPPPPDTFNFQDLIDEIKAKETSEARRAANRANAQHSTGPRTEEGKAKSSMNAVKTGLTGRTVVLPNEDIHAYYDHLDRHFADFSPATDKEKALVKTIADTEWRLLRIGPLEAGIYAVGRRKLADQFADEPDVFNREDLINAEVLLTYRKDFSNLALQERRLRSQRKADIAELQQLQHERIQQRLDYIEHARRTGNRCAFLKRDFDPPALGFDFTFDEYMHFLQQNHEHYELTERELNFDTVVAAYRTAQKEPKAA
jgi:hypothetical protein